MWQRTVVVHVLDRIMETMHNNNYSVMTVFIPQADDLEVLPGQTDLHSDRGSRYGQLIYCWSRKSVRVLSSIYRLAKKSRVAEGHELPSGIRNHASPEIVWNEYALRCNLVHFETQFWEMLQWYFISFFRCDHVPCYIVPLDREYFLHVHWSRRVGMIFPI